MINQPLTRRHFVGKIMLAATGAALISATKSSHWQLGCYTRPWDKHDYRVALDGIAAAGFRYAGLMSSKSGTVITKDTTPEQAGEVAEEAKSRGLKIISVYGGNFDVRKSVDEGKAALKRLIDSSEICGSRKSPAVPGRIIKMNSH